MSEAKAQKMRILEIKAPDGVDVLLQSMHGTETLGRLFQFELDLIAETTPVDHKKILGQNVTVRLDLVNKETRYFNGYISRFMLVGVQEPKEGKKIYQYRATMVPWFWFLTRNSDCRIYQGKTVLEIIKDVFDRKGFQGFYDDQTAGRPYRTWEYCVQYRETDFNFVSRLLEHEGIYYYFKQENGKHTLVLCDGPSDHNTITTEGVLHFDEPDLKTEDDNFIWNWTLGQEITPNKYCITDYDPLDPQGKLEKQDTVEHSHDPDTYEIFDYPGGYHLPGDGKEYVKLRMEELEAQYATGRGTSGCRTLFAGCLFKLVDHPAYDPVEYLIVSTSYQMRNNPYGSTGGGGGGAGYVCQVSCIPKEYEYRSPRTTHKPIVQGPQTAIVVGPQNEEIHCDKYGRVRVHFYWDRWGTEDEKASCWIRVSQPWAGLKWGAINIPRMGQEVIVEFLEGDPDRPIITGRVYNGVNMPPYELPTNQTMTTMKTNTSKGGGGFNEFRFEDKQGEEQIFMHAQKNMDLRVVNDRFETVGHNMHVTVGADSMLNVKANYHVIVASNYKEDVGADHHINIKGNQNENIDGNRSLNITGSLDEAIGASHSTSIGGKRSLTVTGDISVQSDASITLKVGGSSITIDASGITIKTDGYIETDSGGRTEMTVGAALKMTAASIKQTAQGGFDVDGASVKLNAKGKVDMSAGGMIKAAASMIKLN